MAIFQRKFFPSEKPLFATFDGIAKEYIRNFKKIVKKYFEKQSGEDNRVELVFYRIYLIERKG